MGVDVVEVEVEVEVGGDGFDVVVVVKEEGGRSGDGEKRI